MLLNSHDEHNLFFFLQQRMALNINVIFSLLNPAKSESSKTKMTCMGSFSHTNCGQTQEMVAYIFLLSLISMMTGFYKPVPGPGCFIHEHK